MIRTVFLRHRRFFFKLMSDVRQATSSLIQHLRETAGWSHAAKLSRDDVRVKLSDLELISYQFSLEEIIDAVANYLNITITKYDYPDLASGMVPEYGLKAGDLAELNYNEERTHATIVVRESLKYRPWPAYVLSVLHELGHLLAGHYRQRPQHALNPSTLRLDGILDKEPLDSETTFEVEARKWAKALLMAHAVPDVFGAEGTDRPT